jgi:hypothetical protein
MYTAGTKTISKDNNCVVQRRRDIIFTETQFAWQRNITSTERNAELQGEREIERERETLST